MLLCCQLIFSQQDSKNDNANNIYALLNNRLSTYNPVKALQMGKKAAENGDARAMNAIGVIYSKGLADTIDYRLALKWFKSAAEYGYANAWINLALLYKNGLGVKQDFAQAYLYFSKSAEQNSSAGIYSQGYMLYKGLGCEQNYEKAVQLFKSSTNQGNLASMYMLGLCFRNGYGIIQNTDSARYWLQTASNAGFRWAADELMAKDPENTTVINTEQQVRSENKQSSASYIKVKQDLSQSSIEGEYNGYAIKYDWSGRNIISKSTLRLLLSCKDSLITGTWIEDDSIKTDISAILLDSAVVFNNTEYSKKDHYNIKVPNKLEFRNASLQLIQLTDSVYLAGNVQLYSSTYGEPEKPIYIVLSKAPGKLSKVEKSNVFVNNKAKVPDNLNIDSGSIDLMVYPNPFKNTCSVSFNLIKDGQVIIKLVDLSGRVMYTTSELLHKGRHITKLNTELSTGSYILYLSTNDKTERTILLKQQP